jgi:hypothetical protein
MIVKSSPIGTCWPLVGDIISTALIVYGNPALGITPLSGGDDADGDGCRSFPVPGCKNCAYEVFVHMVGKINAKLSNNAINLKFISVLVMVICYSFT